MGLWQRIKRVFSTSADAALDRLENPELTIQKTIRDMRERIPDLNNSVAQVMATERLLTKEKSDLEKQVVDFDAKIKAAVKMNRDDMATMYIGQLQQAQVDLERKAVLLEQAGAASAQALKARDNYILNVKKRSAEAMQLVNAARQAKVQEQLAQTMETFNIGDDASTFNEMREKIDRRVAAAEAKLQLGAASVDNQMFDIEREARDIQLQDKLLEYKQQMGMLGAGTPPESKQIGSGAPSADIHEADILDIEQKGQSN